MDDSIREVPRQRPCDASWHAGTALLKMGYLFEKLMKVGYLFEKRSADGEMKMVDLFEKRSDASTALLKMGYLFEKRMKMTYLFEKRSEDGEMK